MQKSTLCTGLLALFAASAPAQVFGPMVTQGGTLDDAAAEQLETSLLSAIIDKDGKVKSATLIDGHPLLAPAALDAVKNWVSRRPSSMATR